MSIDFRLWSDEETQFFVELKGLALARCLDGGKAWHSIAQAITIKDLAEAIAGPLASELAARSADTRPEGIQTSQRSDHLKLAVQQ